MLNDMKAYQNRMINQQGFLHIRHLHRYKEQEDRSIISFTRFFEVELAESTYKPQSKKPQRTTLNHFKSFRKEVFFDDLNYSLVDGFDKFLHKQGLGANTIHKHHKTVRKYINIAIRKDLFKIDKDPYKNYKARTTQPKRNFLTEVELKRIEDLRFSKENAHLNRVRDFFLVLCYLGMRYGELNALCPNHIEEGSNGLQVRYKAEKTSKTHLRSIDFLFKVPGSDMSRPERILRHWLYEHKEDELKPTYPIFRRLTNQYLNKSLKKLARLAKIPKALTSHDGRRTFTSILNDKGVSTATIQQLLGHSTPQMTMAYVEQGSDKRLRDGLERIEW